MDLGDKINFHTIVLTGDLNLPNVSWDDHCIIPGRGGSCRAADKLLSLVEEMGLYQHVNKPTRKQGKTENILDLVFTSNPEEVEELSVTDGIADHNSVVVDLHIAPTRKRPVKRKVYLRDRADVDSITKDFRI